MIKPPNILLMGPPGSGKTSLGENLQEAFEESDVAVEYISLGALSLQLASDSSERIELDRLYAQSAGPVGDPSLFLRILQPALLDSTKQERGIILDGIPKKHTEVGPLIEHLGALGMSIDWVIECVLDKDVALQRVELRGVRDSGKDTLDVARERHLRYDTSRDTLIEPFITGRPDRLLLVDTNNIGIDEYQSASIPIVRTIVDGASYTPKASEYLTMPMNEVRGVEATEQQRISKMSDGELLEHVLTDAIYELVQDISTTGIENVALQLVPELADTPNLLKRYKNALQSQLVQPAEHLIAQARKELELRLDSGEDELDASTSIISAIESASRTIEEFSRNYSNISSSSKVLADEVEANRAYLEVLVDGIKDETGRTLRSEELMGLQPALWNITTTSDVKIIQDANYQRAINGIPGSHHSLAPPTVPDPRVVLSNSIGEYTPFIEAVSSTNRGDYQTSFGFLHVVGVDSEGMPYQIEWPVFMVDPKLLAVNNPLVQSIISRSFNIDFNHDIWHNLIPVYSESFNLFHPDAPIAFGGLTDEYSDFGKKLRRYKEEYEIGVALGHSQNIVKNPGLKSGASL